MLVADGHGGRADERLAEAGVQCTSRPRIVAGEEEKTPLLRDENRLFAEDGGQPHNLARLLPTRRVRREIDLPEDV